MKEFEGVGGCGLGIVWSPNANEPQTASTAFPIAAEACPLAVVRYPVAVEKGPLAVVRYPIAVEALPLAVVFSPTATERFPLASTVSPIAKEMEPLGVIDEQQQYGERRTVSHFGR